VGRADADSEQGVIVTDERGWPPVTLAELEADGFIVPGQDRYRAQLVSIAEFCEGRIRGPKPIDATTLRAIAHAARKVLG
jgi:hypothetical protein